MDAVYAERCAEKATRGRQGLMSIIDIHWGRGGIKNPGTRGAWRGSGSGSSSEGGLGAAAAGGDGTEDDQAGEGGGGGGLGDGGEIGEAGRENQIIDF